jgi:hypothetical protein
MKKLAHGVTDTGNLALTFTNLDFCIPPQAPSKKNSIPIEVSMVDLTPCLRARLAKLAPDGVKMTQFADSTDKIERLCNTMQACSTGGLKNVVTSLEITGNALERFRKRPVR